MPKKIKIKISQALLFTGIVPVLKKQYMVFDRPVYINLWFNDVIVRNKFLERSESEGFEKDFIHMDDVDDVDMERAILVYKVKKKKVKHIPLVQVYEHYQQYGAKVVDNR